MSYKEQDNRKSRVGMLADCVCVFTTYSHLFISRVKAAHYGALKLEKSKCKWDSQHFFLLSSTHSLTSTSARYVEMRHLNFCLPLILFFTYSFHFFFMCMTFQQCLLKAKRCEPASVILLPITIYFQQTVWHFRKLSAEPLVWSFTKPLNTFAVHCGCHILLCISVAPQKLLCILHMHYSFWGANSTTKIKP